MWESLGAKIEQPRAIECRWSGETRVDRAAGKFPSVLFRNSERMSPNVDQKRSPLARILPEPEPEMTRSDRLTAE